MPQDEKALKLKHLGALWQKCFSGPSAQDCSTSRTHPHRVPRPETVDLELSLSLQIHCGINNGSLFLEVTRYIWEWEAERCSAWQR